MEVAPLEHGEEPAVADAIAHVVSAAGRVLEDRITLMRLELRRDALHMLRAGALKMYILAAQGAAMGLGVAAVVLVLTRWMSHALALGVVAAAFAVVAAGLGVVVRRGSTMALGSGAVATGVDSGSKIRALAERGGR